MSQSNQLYLLFAELFGYPRTDLAQQVDGWTELLVKACPAAGVSLVKFRDYIRQVPLEHVQENYTQAFDLQGVCPLYVGHQLFGESYKRSWFMARLNEEYHHRSFTTGAELPDHVAVILRFLAQGHEDEFSQVLRNEGLIPALEKMLRSFCVGDENPYLQVIEALSQTLKEPGLMGPMEQVGSELEE